MWKFCGKAQSPQSFDKISKPEKRWNFGILRSVERFTVET